MQRKCKYCDLMQVAMKKLPCISGGWWVGHILGDQLMRPFIFISLKWNLLLSLFLINVVNSINFSIYEIQVDKEISKSYETIVLKKLDYINKINCFIHCKKSIHCEYVAYNSSMCILYKSNARFYVKQGSTIQLYRIKNLKK